MAQRDEPGRILAREEARSRQELASARAALERHLTSVVDPSALVRRHPFLALLGGAAGGFFAAGPLRAAFEDAVRGTGSVAPALRKFAGIAARALASAVLTRGLGEMER